MAPGKEAGRVRRFFFLGGGGGRGGRENWEVMLELGWSSPRLSSDALLVSAARLSSEALLAMVRATLNADLGFRVEGSASSSEEEASSPLSLSSTVDSIADASRALCSAHQRSDTRNEMALLRHSSSVLPSDRAQQITCATCSPCCTLPGP